MVVTVCVAALIPVSFHYIPGWTNARVYVYIEHGLLCANPDRILPGTPPVTIPWYGSFHIAQSKIYTPWQFWPKYRRFSVGS
jgi:hypothetical protein